MSAAKYWQGSPDWSQQLENKPDWSQQLGEITSDLPLDAPDSGMAIERENIGIFLHATALTATGGLLLWAIPTDAGLLLPVAIVAGLGWLGIGYAAAAGLTATGSGTLLGVFRPVLPVTAEGEVARPGMAELAMFVYVVAVIGVGSFLTESLGLETVPPVLGLSVLFGLLWTAYFRADMLSRLERLREGRLPEWVEEMIPEDEPDPDELDDSDDETPGDVEYPWKQ